MLASAARRRHASIDKGALLGERIPGLAGQGVAHGQWWRIVTGGFLHENLLHIGFNMYVLYILGTDARAGARARQVRARSTACRC